MPDNQLFYGDNLDVLRRHVADESVDLVYLDPPFKSNQDYNILFTEQDGSRAAAQIRAFEDTWQWDTTAARAYEEILQVGGKVTDTMQAFRICLGQNDMLAYLAMMAPRLLELHRILKPTGSIYLHCDPAASHYLKMLMDAVFGPETFRNEIVWRRTGSHNSRRTMGRIHDIILFFSKSADYTFNIVRKPYMKGHVETRYTKMPNGKMKFTSGGNVLTGAGAVPDGESGKEWRGFDPTAKGRHWAVPSVYEEMMPHSYKKLTSTDKLESLYKAGLVEIEEGSAWPIMVRYLDERDGMPLQDLWTAQPYTEETVFGSNDIIDADVQWMGPTSPERLRYPTQKPVGLMERILATSSNQGETVLDPFCGCGTTIEVAQKLGRQWIGIDVTHLTIGLIKSRLRDAFGENISKTYEVVGEPTNLPDAQQLADTEPYQFQCWALGLVGARKEGAIKKGADRGIDGKLIFEDDTKKSGANTVIIAVKGGNTGPAHVRDLLGVVESEKAAIGVLITMHETTKPMRTAAAAAGFYHSPWGRKQHPKIQILTIEELLGGAAIDMPPHQTNVTFKKARRQKRNLHTGKLAWMNLPDESATRY
jgi:site-specific DNA-methyltransferase (adenine-specific)